MPFILDASQPLSYLYCFAIVMLALRVMPLCMNIRSNFSKLFWVFVSIVVAIPAVFCLFEAALFYVEQGVL